MTEEDLVEMLLAFLPESFEGWLAYAVAISAVLSYVLPKPADEAHFLLKAGHRLICVLGLGASKIRAAGTAVRALRGKKAGE